MTLSDICIRRPVFATVLSLIVVLLGLMAYDRLAVREYPNIDEPVVTVTTKLVGASSDGQRHLSRGQPGDHGVAGRPAD